MTPRRKQKVVQVRSDFIAEQLKLRTRDGRSQVAVLEDAVKQLPPVKSRLTETEKAEHLARIRALQEAIARLPERLLSMAEFDAEEYDENGDPR